MRLLIIQPVADVRTKQHPYRHAIALLAAVLRRQNHRVSLLVVGPGDDALLASAVTDLSPLSILMYVDSLAADPAYHVAEKLQGIRAVPLIVFGPHATLCPNDCLSMGGVEAVAIGPADASVPEYLQAHGKGPEFVRTPGLWVNCETGVMRNPPARPPQSLDDQPLPARDLYPDLLDSAGYAEVRVARGGEAGSCPDEPALPADVAAAWSAPAAWPVRLRTASSVLAEMALLAHEHLDIGGFRLTNERWASALPWLEEFAPRYRKDIGIPLRTALHAPDVSDRAAALLKQAGCEEVRVRVGSGSAFIRNEILGLPASTEELEAAFGAMRGAGLRTAAHVEVGAPYETAVTLEETAALLGRLQPDRVEAALHWPAPGSPSHAVARENGWLVPDAVTAHLAGKPSLALPSLSEDQLVTAAECLPYQVVRPRIVPLIRMARRVRIGKRRTLYEVLVRQFLAPPVKRG